MWQVILSPTRIPVMLLRLIFAAILGAILGLERELRKKTGGVKTNALVSLASCGFILIVREINSAETARVITGIIQGVGFIGGGLILKAGNTAKNVTGAAEIWVSSAIGIACGVGLWQMAISLLLISLLLLRLTRKYLPPHSPNSHPQ